MLTGGLAKRYAQALMNAVLDESALERTAEELKAFLRLWTGKSDLVAALASPVVTARVKKEIIGSVLAARALPLTVDFLCLLAEKKRLQLLPAVSEALDELIRKKRGIEQVNVISALPVNAGEGAALKARLELLFGRRVELAVEHKPSLLCGIQIRVGDRFFDGSGSGKLAQIRTLFSNY